MLSLCLGGSCYPCSCAATDLLHALLLSVGAGALLAMAKAQAQAGLEMAVCS